MVLYVLYGLHVNGFLHVLHALHGEGFWTSITAPDTILPPWVPTSGITGKSGASPARFRHCE